MKIRRNDEWITKVDAELARWTDVSHYREMSAKHNRLILIVGDKSKFVTYPATPTGKRRALLNHIGDVRRTLRELGSEKTT